MEAILTALECDRSATVVMDAGFASQENINWLQQSGVDFISARGSLQMSSGQLATAAAQEGLGVALADSTLTSREIKSGKLVVPFDIQLDTNRAFYLVYRKQRPLTVGMKAFKEWLMSEM